MISFQMESKFPRAGVVYSMYDNHEPLATTVEFPTHDATFFVTEPSRQGEGSWVITKFRAGDVAATARQSLPTR